LCFKNNNQNLDNSETKKKRAEGLLDGMSSNLDNSVSSRKISLSRFEVEKVDETSDLLNASIKEKMNDSIENPKQNKAAEAEPAAEAHHSNLKKTVKHFIYDDDFFDLNSGQNTATDKKAYLQSQSSYEKQPLNAREDNNDDDEEDEATAAANSKKEDDASVGCFQINYNEKNDPTSITCNLNSAGVNSYKNCVHDFKTVFFYQKLIAEFTGTLLLTLYACSIGLPIGGSAVPSIDGKFCSNLYSNFSSILQFYKLVESNLIHLLNQK
jgi:hypothetical protein